MSMRAGSVTIDGRRVGTIILSVLDGSDEEGFSHHSNVINASYHPDGGVGGSDRGYGSTPREAHGGGNGERRSGGGQVHGGSYGGNSGGKSGANYLGSSRARADGVGDKGLTTVDTKAGKITVNKDAAGDMAGAINDLVDAGAPVGHVGSYANRNIAGSRRKSQHAFGGAMDLFNQSGRGEISREGMAWIRANPDKWREIKQKRNLVGGEDFGDIGHVEWGGPGYGERRYGKGNSSPAASGGNKVKGSWFDDHVTATKGVSAANTPGIALPTREGLGKMHEVTGPNGKTVMLPQIDVGPAAWTGRGVDISAPALEQMGYDKKNFPTDAHFDVKPVGDAVPLNFKSNAANEKITNSGMHRRRGDEYISGHDGKVVRRPQNKANWGFDTWKDMRRSDNVDDRTQSKDNSWKGKTSRDYFNQKFQGVLEQQERSFEKPNSRLSKDAGIDSLPFKDFDFEE